LKEIQIWIVIIQIYLKSGQLCVINFLKEIQIWIVIIQIYLKSGQLCVIVIDSEKYNFVNNPHLQVWEARLDMKIIRRLRRSYDQQ